MSEARQNKSEPSEEFARALDRDEARRLETRLLTDSALAEAALRKTAAPGQPVHRSPAPPQALAAEEGVQDGHRVKLEPSESPQPPAASPQPPSVSPPSPEPLASSPEPTPAAPSAALPEEPVPAPPMRRAAVRDRRFLYLAALAVVLPVAVLLISRALQPAPLFPPQMALPQASMRPPRARPNQPVPLGPLENLRRPASATAVTTAQPEGPTPKAPHTASPSPASTAAVTPPAKPPVTHSAPTSAASAPVSPGVEPFFKRAP